MENSRIEAALDDAIEAFRGTTDAPEDGLTVDDPALLQLRKACRLLEAGEFLAAENGYYTLVIEASFGVIERTLQFYLLEAELLHEDEFVSHEHVYDRGEQAGLFAVPKRDLNPPRRRIRRTDVLRPHRSTSRNGGSAPVTPRRVAFAFRAQCPPSGPSGPSTEPNPGPAPDGVDAPGGGR